MGIPTNSIKSVPLEGINSAALDPVNFIPININGLVEPCNIIRIINNSNQLVFLSYDGITENEVVRAGSDLNLFITANATSNITPSMAKGTIVYARGTAGIGFIYLSGYYQ